MPCAKKISYAEAISRLAKQFELLRVSKRDKCACAVRCRDCGSVYGYQLALTQNGNNTCVVCCKTTAKRKLTNEQFRLRVIRARDDITDVQDYTGPDLPVTLTHACGRSWSVAMARVFKTSKCPSCCARKRRTHAEYVAECKALSVKPLEKLRGMRDALKHECLKCGHTWKCMPDSINAGHSCPVCSFDSSNKGRYKRKYVRVNGTKRGFQGYEIEALRILKREGTKLRELCFTAEEGRPTVPYVLDGKQRLYIPDFYHEPTNTIIEVKSNFTLAGRLADFDFLKVNRAKAKACRCAGYNFRMLVVSDTGDLLDATGWEQMSRKQLNRLLNL